MTMNKDFDLLRNDIDSCSNIIDFISIIYFYISKLSHSQIKQKYKKSLSIKKIESLYKEIHNNMDILLNWQGYKNGVQIYDNYFNDFKKSCEEIFFNNNEYIDILCYETLAIFDTMYLDYVQKNFSTKIKFIQGPLNSKFKDKVFFYNKPPKRYNEELFLKNKIRHGRQTFSFNSDSLSEDYKNFEIIKCNSINDYTLNVIAYNEEFDGKSLKIGINPLNVKNYVNIDFEKSDYTVRIKYINDMKQNALKKIKQCLYDMEEKGANIVVFPELALYPDFLNALKKFLINYDFKNLKLIFTGSQYIDEENIAYILSSKGTLLGTHYKQIAYDIYHENENYSEILKLSKTIDFLDIKGLGRIGYKICKDVLSEEINIIYDSIMHSNIDFLSSYSEKTKMMLKGAKSSTEKFGKNIIMCNACSAIDKKNDIEENLLGFITFPDIKFKNIECGVYKHSKNKFCNNKCETCNFIFEIPIEKM